MLIRVLRPEEVEELYKRTHAEEIARVEKERKERAYKGLVLEAMDYPPQWQERFFKIEDIYNIYGKSLQQFMLDCDELWIERERSVDEHDIEEQDAPMYYGEDEDNNEEW